MQPNFSYYLAAAVLVIHHLVKYNVTSTGWLYTASCLGQLYLLFLIFLSLFSSAISLCIWLTSSHLLHVLILYSSSYILIYCFLFYSFSLHFLLHNLSWYQSYSSKPLHTGWRATRSSNSTELTRILRAFDTDFSQGLESCPSYSRKILAGNFHEEADRSTLKDRRKKLTHQSKAYNARKIEEEESAEEETLKILVIFKNHQRIHEEELQKAETLKISWNSFKFVKDCCRRQHRLKNFGNCSNLLKTAADNAKL